MKTELEEAAKDFIENTMKFSFTSNDTKTLANRMLKCVEFGAKWQQEQDKNLYSEEDMKQFGLYLGDNLKKLKGKTIDEIFEQFKNK